MLHNVDLDVFYRGSIDIGLCHVWNRMRQISLELMAETSSIKDVNTCKFLKNSIKSRRLQDKRDGSGYTPQKKRSEQTGNYNDVNQQRVPQLTTHTEACHCNLWKPHSSSVLINKKYPSILNLN